MFRCLLLLLASLAWAQSDSARPAREHTLTGEFRTHKAFHSKYLAADRDILVWLPPGYEKSDARYPVFYLNDGQNVFDGATSFIPGQEWRADETADSLIRAGAIQPLIVVGIYNSGEARIDEYTPGKDAKYNRGGMADRYGRMLIEELKPLIDRQYRTRPEPASTVIGGSSLGGLLSLYLALAHPGVFGNAAVLSPSVWWNQRALLKQVEALNTKVPARIWLDIGTAEGKNPSEPLADVRLLRDALIAKGWTLNRDLAYREVTGGQHNESAWADRLGDVLRFFEGRPATEAR